MDCFATNDASDFFFTVNPHTLADRDGAVLPAYGAEINEAVLADIVDKESYLIHMSREHDFGFSARIKNGGYVSVNIGDLFVGERICVVSIDLGSSFLKPRRTRSIGEEF